MYIIYLILPSRYFEECIKTSENDAGSFSGVWLYGAIPIRSYSWLLVTVGGHTRAFRLLEASTVGRQLSALKNEATAPATGQMIRRGIQRMESLTIGASQ